MSKNLFGSLLLCGVWAGAAISQPIDAPHNERGFSADKVFEMGDIDHISPFDGSLLLTIPIGGTYPLRPGFAYGLTLTYNGKIFDVEYPPNPPFDYYQIYEPHPGYNAGVGWTLSLGELREPGSTLNNSNALWTYVAGDGSKHDFYSELHPGESQAGSSFTRDNTYLRMRLQGAQRVVEFPDGSKRFFEDSFEGTGVWNMVRLEDAFGNWMTVDYTPTEWTIDDMHGRQHKVTLIPAVDPLDRVVDKVEVEQFGTETLAVWDFSYENISLNLKDCALTSDGQDNRTFQMKFLSTIDLPDGSSYEMPDYEIESNQPLCNELTTGRIQELKLPTGGWLAWDYGHYPFPTESCDTAGCFSKFTPSEIVVGVVARRLEQQGTRAVEGEWTYAPVIDAAIEGSERKTTVTDPLGHRTVYYFSIHRHEYNYSGGWTRYEYGLPYTRNVPLAATLPGGYLPALYLSQEVIPAGDSEPIRSVYVGYERELPISSQLSDVQNANRRLSHQLTVFHDVVEEGVGFDAFSETIFENYDGLGNYRTVTQRGNLLALHSIESKQLHTEFNPNRGTLVIDPSTGLQDAASDFSLPGASAAWVLQTSSFTEHSQGASTLRSESTFRSDGFLRCQRWLAGTSRGGNDVLRVFDDADDDGNADSETTYGGDGAAIGTSAGCTTSAAPEYKTRYTYEAGAVESSVAVKLCGGGSGAEDFLVLADHDIDAHTGLASTRRDAAGTPTDFTYDALSRLTSVVPGSNPEAAAIEADAPTLYSYSPHSSANHALVDIQRGSTTSPLSHQRIIVDGFGRVCREQTKMPDDSWNQRLTKYEPTGWIAEVSTTVAAAEAGTDCGTWGSTPKTTYLAYDPFGRAGTVRPPDGASHDVDFLRQGTRSVERQVSTAINSNGTEASVSKISYFDSFGRLVQVTEASDDIGEGSVGNIHTNYFYTPRDQIWRVRTLSPNHQAASMDDPSAQKVDRSHENQNRYFTYDGRGFLTSEDQPETGQISYSYDSHGNLLTKDDGRVTLRTVYDAASRPTQVWEDSTGSERLFKEFSYATENRTGEWSLGKLAETRRHNYLDIDDPLNRSTSLRWTTSQRMTYGGLGGRVSKQVVVALRPDGHAAAFDTEFTYDALGNLSSLDYPDCLHAGCPGGEVGTLALSYSNGFLAGISGYLAGITYHPNGLVDTVTHANGRVDTTTIAANGMARPASISTSGSPTWSSGTYAYDGAGNVKSIGSDTFQYDRVDRLVRAKLDGSIAANHFRAYQYDIHGNRVSIDKNGVLSSIGVQTGTNRLSAASYDLSGNVTSYQGQTNSWDAGNLLMASTGSGYTKAYLYTADDERLATLDLSGATDQESWTLRGLGSQVLRTWKVDDGAWSWDRDQIYRGSQVAAAETANDAGALHYHLDHLGSPRLITTSTGTLKSQHTYFPFGEEYTSPGDEILKFTGHERDENGTALDYDYMHARYCLPQTGTFLSVDPINSAKPQVPQSWNKYAYARNNPVKFVDKTGEESSSAIRLEMNLQRVLDGELSEAEFWETQRTPPALASTLFLGVGAVDVGIAAAPALLSRLGYAARVGGWFGELRSRVRRLGTDPVRGFLRAEGIGGARIEAFLGRKIRRSTDEAADFIDSELGPISLKGPIPGQGSIEGLAAAAVKDANFNTATKALFVDLRGLSITEQRLVRDLVAAGTENSQKLIHFLD